MRTQVRIIGGGPSGLLLSQLLHLNNIDTMRLERRTRDYVLGRIRAGILEFGTVELLREAGAGSRMDREGIVHDGTFIATRNRGFRVDFKQRTGKQIMVYGQTDVTADLYGLRDEWDAQTVFEVDAVKPQNIDTSSPFVTFLQDGKTQRIDCDYVAGCDGFHGVNDNRKLTQAAKQSLKRFARNMSAFIHSAGLAYLARHRRLAGCRMTARG